MQFTTSRVSVRDLQMLTERWRDDRVGLYDRVLPKRPEGDVFMIIPRGRRCNLWFTYFKEVPACFIVETNRSNEISSIFQVPAVFDKVLAYGTVLTGVMSNSDNGSYFCCTMVQKSIGHECKRSLRSQLQNMNKTLSLIGGRNLPVIQVCCPDILTNYKDVEERCVGVKYQTYGLKVCDSVKDYCIGICLMEQSRSENYTLLVKPEVEEDLYSLWSGKQIGYAVVPDLKTSRMLNGIFRNIKENDNLDAIEESDDEDDFENIDPSKFILRSEGISMTVRYDYRFKGWVPINISNTPPSAANLIDNVEKRTQVRGALGILNTIDKSSNIDRNVYNKRHHTSGKVRYCNVKKSPSGFIG